MIVHPDPSVLLSDSWQQWSIPLEDLTNLKLIEINSMTITIGDNEIEEGGIPKRHIIPSLSSVNVPKNNSKWISPGTKQLLDLKNDIGEKNNVAKQHRNIVTKIEDIMKSARTPSEHWRMPGE